MELNEIKKLLYKQKPIAVKFADTGEHLFYDATVEKYQFMFVVPYSEIGESKFNDSEPAHLLIRWYTNFNII